jgi:hypothetical protein
MEITMGTKNNPGKFDCYANAKPDEPMFILLGRDKNAPSLVDLWANQRELDGEDPTKVQEARDCASTMRRYAGIERPVLAQRLTRLTFELNQELQDIELPEMARTILGAMCSVIKKS